MQPVYYLCHSDKPGNVGFVFPNELVPDSYTPGIWAVVPNSDGNLDDVYLFDAVNDTSVEKFELKRVHNSIYQVIHPKHGIIRFRIVMWHYGKDIRYLGNSPLIKTPNVFHVVPVNVLQLEEICAASQFFFVGQVDEENINSQSNSQ